MIRTAPRSTASRRRLVEAMGLGPSWVLRSKLALPLGDAPADPVSSEARALRIAHLDLEALRDDVAGCVACGLCRSRTRTVFGAGVERPDWLIVGTAPGADDDARGEPFVGQAGKLLDAMLAAVGLSRERGAFLVNTVKCRTPDDRDPFPEEAATCRPYLERQIALLAPRMILAVGHAASRALLGSESPMIDLRGKRHALLIDDRAIPLVVTHDPAQLLQAGDEKAQAWADLCFAREVLREIEATPS